MLEEQRKIVRITAELTMFFLEVGAGNISSHVEIEGSVGKINFRADYRPGCEEKLREMEKCLSEQTASRTSTGSWRAAGTMGRPAN